MYTTIYNKLSEYQKSLLTNFLNAIKALDKIDKLPEDITSALASRGFTY
jgi:hypothetical protein